jgi:hypothetical protein
VSIQRELRWYKYKGVGVYYLWESEKGREMGREKALNQLKRSDVELQDRRSLRQREH